MFRRLFLDHPASVGESYVEHFGVATRFGVRMLVGGMGAVIHGVLPFAFKTTGSRTIAGLHAEMVAKRTARREAETQLKTVEYVI
jgi:acyl-[acyl carrier protein]--UDP-N-acetylglucosamine O-acyltransferase